MATTPPLARLAIDLMTAVGEAPATFEGRLVTAVNEAIGAVATALWRPAMPEWRLLSAAPGPSELPEAAAEALDADRPVELSGWLAVPTASPRGAAQPDVLTLRNPPANLDAEALGRLVFAARSAAYLADQDASRTERLEPGSLAAARSIASPGRFFAMRRVCPAR